MPTPSTPPKPSKVTNDTVQALGGSTWDSSGGFKPSGSSLVHYLLFQGDMELTFATTAEAGPGLILPIDQPTHAVLAAATYQGGGVWKDGQGQDWQLELSGPGGQAKLTAVQA